MIIWRKIPGAEEIYDSKSNLNSFLNRFLNFSML